MLVVGGRIGTVSERVTGIDCDYFFGLCYDSSVNYDSYAGSLSLSLCATRFATFQVLFLHFPLRAYDSKNIN